MTEIKIEKGIPLPKMFNTRLSIRATVPNMKVGDSFFIEAPNDVKLTSFKAYVLTLVKQIALPLGHKHTSRSVDGGLRVWRTQ